MLVFQNLYFIYANEIQMGVCAIKVVWGQKLEPLRWAWAPHFNNNAFEEKKAWEKAP